MTGVVSVTPQKYESSFPLHNWYRVAVKCQNGLTVSVIYAGGRNYCSQNSKQLADVSKALARAENAEVAVVYPNKEFLHLRGDRGNSGVIGYATPDMVYGLIRDIAVREVRS